MRDRLGRRIWLLLAASIASILVPPHSRAVEPAPAAAAGVTREDVEQSIKIGVGFLLKSQRRQRHLGQRGRRVGPGDPRPADRRRVARLRADAPGPRVPPQRQRQPGPRDLHPLAADDGLRRRRPREVSRRDRPLRRVARAGPDPAGRLDLQRRPATGAAAATTRTPSTPCSASTPPARPASPSGPRSGSRPGATGRRPRTSTAAGAITPAGGATGSMTCAGDLQPDHHRPEARPGARAARRRPDRSAAARRPSPPASSGRSTGCPLHFDVTQNINSGQSWHYYYLYGLERVGRLSGRRFFGNNDWYREGAAYLVRTQDPLARVLARAGDRAATRCMTTSFALLFLAKGRSPVLVNKLRHGPGPDWNNDHDDITNLVGVVSRDWKHLLTWQVVDPNVASVEDMLQAPIAYFNGHEAPDVHRRRQGQAPRLRRARRRDRRRGLLLAGGSSTEGSGP